jgi:predicted nucleic acid-binding protein
VSLSTAPVYLLDANVLLRLAQSTHPQHAATRAALQTLRAGGARLVTAPQSLYEFWAVASRPAINRGGLGMPTAGVTAYLNLFEQHFPALPEVPVYAEWKRLVTSYGVSGLNSHDARLAAFMLVHGVTHLLTFNTKDFNRYTRDGLTIVDPASLPATL